MEHASFVEYLKIRRQSGDSLRAIAGDFGVDIMAVWFWCNGRRKPRRSQFKLAEMLVREQLARGLGKDWPEFK